MKTTKLKPEASLSDIKSTKSKPLTKTQPNMDGEDFLADTPQKGKITKPNSKTLDGEKFLSTKEKKIKSFESFINENLKKELNNLEDLLDKILDTEPENEEEKKDQKELLNEIEDEINDIKSEIAEKENENIKSFESFVNEDYHNTDRDKFNYMMLDRLKGDCEYFLGYGNGSENVLPSKNIEEHINHMKEIWEKLPVKPEWLSYEQIEDYEKRMLDLRENPKPYWNPDDVIVK